MKVYNGSSIREVPRKIWKTVTMCVCAHMRAPV